MKKIFLSILFSSLSYFLVSQNMEFNKEYISSKAKYNSEQYLTKSTNTKGVGDNYDIIYHRFNWNINPDTLFIQGSVFTIFKYTSTSNADSIQFSMHNQLKVDSIKSKYGNLLYNHTDSVLTIHYPTLLFPGKVDSLEIFYHGSPVSGINTGSFVKDTHQSTPIIWTLSQPYGAYEWWPCKNSLTDKIDSIDIIITTPFPHVAVANGIKVAEYQSCAFTTVKFEHRYPIVSYLIAFAATNYQLYTDTLSLNTNNLLIVNYVYPEEFNDVILQTDKLKDIIGLYDSILGDYPFIEEQYGHARMQRGGGMEHQTISFMGTYDSYVVSHELVHSWFGNMITCSSWQNIWLNEGFATYFGALYYKYRQNGIWWNVWKDMARSEIISQPDGSVYVYDTTYASRIFDARLSYYKGAMVLNNLYYKLGENNFYLAIRNYIQDVNLQYSFANTNDFKIHLEAVCGYNLDNYFDQWIYGEGYPIYSFSCDYINLNNYNFIINQQQSIPQASFFEMDVPILFKGGGKDSLIVFNNYYNGQDYQINLEFLIEEIVFDPDITIIADLDTVVLNITEFEFDNNRIYPNPGDNIIFIDGVLYDDIITIYNLSSKMIIEEEYKNGIDVSGLKEGVYFIQYNDNTYKFNVIH